MASIALNEFFSHYYYNPSEKVRGGEAMHHELLRLNTFASWPSSATGWPSALARAGFYFEGKDDETRCFSCKGTVRHWLGTDTPFDEHIRLHPQCPFILGKDARNVPLEPPEGSVPALPTPVKMRSDRSGTERNVDDTDVQPGGTVSRDDHSFVPSGLGTTSDSGITQAAGLNPLTLSDHERAALMKREKVRLLTYYNWSRDNPVQAQYLARAGFYFVGPYDRVKCAFCQNVLRNWVAGDDPDAEHAKYYPDCPFVLGKSVQARNVGNVPAEFDNQPLDATLSVLAKTPTGAQQASQLGIMTDRPRHPEYAIEYERLKTFTNFPATCPVRPEILANAGFFFTGSGDCVRCFFCDMGLRHWEPGDEPWEEHARWYPRCNFIQTVKGDAYIQEIQKKYGRASTAAAAAAAAAAPGGAAAIPGGAAVQSGSGSGWLNTQLNTPSARSVLEMGYSKALVTRVLQRHKSTHGTGFTNVQSLLEAIFEIEETGDDDPMPAAGAAMSASSLAGPQTLRVTDEAVSQISDLGAFVQSQAATKKPEATAPSSEVAVQRSGGDDTPGDEQSIIEENRQLKEQRVCKVCMDNDVNIVFLPCGHLCCCSSCAPALRNCPICRQLVRGTVRIFLS